MKLPDTQHLYIRSMGKLLRVTGLFTSDTRANNWLKINSDNGVKYDDKL